MEDRIKLALDVVGVAGLLVAVRVHQWAGLIIAFGAALGHTIISVRARWRD